MKSSYSQTELDAITSAVAPRQGWNFSRMSDLRAPVPWDYRDVVADHLNSDVDLLDIGTGGGEMLLSFAPHIRSALGIDVDPLMVATATENGRHVSNVSFRHSSHLLERVPEPFAVVLSRHAPFSLDHLASNLRPDGYFITQQVGERNMANVKAALGQSVPSVPLSRAMFSRTGLTLVDFREYDVEYVVKDVESLVFWLGALDYLHADVEGAAALADADAFNGILRGNVSAEGFVTNEHRYVAVAQMHEASVSSGRPCARARR